MLSAFVSILVAMVSTGMGLDSLGIIYTAYTRACMRLENERELLKKCQDPAFFKLMSLYPVVCSNVEANARVGAIWIALKEVTDAFRLVWKPWLAAVLVALCVLLPVCWVCLSSVSTRVSRYRRGNLIPRHRHCREI